MSLTIDEVRKVAQLARLRFSSDEEAKFAAQLAAIVDYIDQLRALEVDDEPLAAGGSAGVEAEDRPSPCLDRELFLANTPAHLGPFLVVPAVKGGEDA